MDKLMAPHDRPIAAGYRVAGVVASLVIFVCFATASWVPWFVADMYWLLPGPGVTGGFARLLLGAVLGLAMLTTPWLAFRWPLFAIVVALLPIVVTVLDPHETGVHFGVLAALGAVAVTSAWRRPAFAVAAVGTALLVVWAWVLSGTSMAAPFGATIDLRYGAGPVGA
jgi:hypothetical protein